MTVLPPITWQNEQRRLGELIPWPDNPRHIEGRQAQLLLESHEEFGQIETLAVSPENEIYNGHGRLNTWIKAYGADHPVDVRVSSRRLTDEERQKLVVLLHKGATGDWDVDKLLKGFKREGLLSWGFDEAELEEMARKAAEGIGEEPGDAEPQTSRADELQEIWQVETGQMWRLPSRTAGHEHRLICGDCTDGDVVARVMGGERADCVVTDPPYGQNQEGVPNDDPRGHGDLMIAAVERFPVDSGVVIAFQSPRLFPNWLTAVSGHKFHRCLWLYKEAQEAYPWHGWILKSEMILVSEIGKGQWLDKHPYSHDCYKVSEVSFRTEQIAAMRTHGSIKPLSVIQDLVSRVGGIVYDPFGGSGTTMVACENLGRQARMIEIHPSYCAVILQRMVDAFGIVPELVKDATGQNISLDMA